MALRIIICLIASLVTLEAEDLYFSQNGAGAADGTSEANAWSLASANTAGNWGAGVGKVSAGDTLWFSGTITNTLTLQGSGSSGSPITIKRITGAKFSSPVFSSSGAIALNSKSFVVIDGTSTAETAFENTHNGTGLTHSNATAFVAGTGTEIQVINCAMTNLYRRTSMADQRHQALTTLECIQVTVNGLFVSNIVASYGSGIVTETIPSSANYSYFCLFNSTLLHSLHHVTLGFGDTASVLTNFFLAGCYIDWAATWDEVNGDNHLDYLIVLNNTADNSSFLVNRYLYNNTLGPNINGTTPSGATAGFSAYLNGQHYQLQNDYIWNNLALFSNSPAFGNGPFKGFGSNVVIWNNTAVGYNTQISATCSNGLVYNNIMGTNGGVWIRGMCKSDQPSEETKTNSTFILNNLMQNIWSDYNIVPTTAGSGSFNVGAQYQLNGSCRWGPSCAIPFYSIAEWNTWNNNSLSFDVPYWSQSHADPNSTGTLPTYVANTLQPSVIDTAANAKGTNLTAVLQGMPGFIPAMLNDKNGNARPSSGRWTIGAYEPSGVVGGRSRLIRILGL